MCWCLCQCVVYKHMFWGVGLLLVRRGQGVRGSMKRITLTLVTACQSKFMEPAGGKNPAHSPACREHPGGNIGNHSLPANSLFGSH